MSDAEILLENANAYIEDLEVRLVSYRDGCKNLGGRLERLEKAARQLVDLESDVDDDFGAAPYYAFAELREALAVGGDPE